MWGGSGGWINYSIHARLIDIDIVIHQSRNIDRFLSLFPGYAYISHIYFYNYLMSVHTYNYIIM